MIDPKPCQPVVRIASFAPTPPAASSPHNCTTRTPCQGISPVLPEEGLVELVREGPRHHLRDPLPLTLRRAGACTVGSFGSLRAVICDGCTVATADSKVVPFHA